MHKEKNSVSLKLDINKWRLERPWLVYSVSKDIMFASVVNFFVEVRESQRLQDNVLKTGKICQASLAAMKNQLII